MIKRGRPIVAVDAGSSHTRVLVAEEVPGGVNGHGMVFRAFGEAESKGWKKGAIINLEAVESSLRKAVEIAERAYGAPIEMAVVGLGASQVKGVNAQSGIAVRHGEVGKDDVRRAVEEARHINIPPDRVVLHVVPQQFVLDSVREVRDPNGMPATNLEASVHVITAMANGQQNLVTACNHAGLEVQETVFEALAAAEAVLSDHERDLGVVLADIGSGSTEVVVYQHEYLQHSFTLQVGGDHFTNDIAVCLRTSIPEAARIKEGFGVAHEDQAGDSTSIEVPRVGDRMPRMVPQRELARILQSRAEELLKLISDQLDRAGLEHQPAIVFTGGGARLAGLCDLAEQQLNLSARIGLGRLFDGAPEYLQEPLYTTLVGLLYYAQRLKHARQGKPETVIDRWKRILTGG